MAVESIHELYGLFPHVEPSLIQQLMSYCTLAEAEAILFQMEDEVGKNGPTATTNTRSGTRPPSARKAGREEAPPARPLTSKGRRWQQQQDEDESMAKQIAMENNQKRPVSRMASDLARPITARTRKQIDEDEAVARQVQLEEEIQSQLRPRPQSNATAPSPLLSLHRSKQGVQEDGSVFTDDTDRTDSHFSLNPPAIPFETTSSLSDNNNRPDAPSPGMIKTLQTDHHLTDELTGSDLESGEDDGFEGVELSAQLRDLFKFVDLYQPTKVSLEPRLQCFVPDYIPAVGDIDPMLKVPEPTALNETIDPKLGLKLLDEPCLNQSDPAIISFELRAMKKTGVPKQPVHKIELHTADGVKYLTQWCQSIYDLHTKKAPDRVVFTKRMPGIEPLMEAWPESVQGQDASTGQEIERLAKEIASWDGSLAGQLDLPLEDMVRLVCALMDIPLWEAEQKASGQQSRAMIESLHLLFSVYAEFRNSQHFGKMSM